MRGLEEVGEQREGYGICVFCMGWETVIRAVEGEGHETDGGHWREGGLEGLDVETGVDKGYGVGFFLFQGFC